MLKKKKSRETLRQEDKQAEETLKKLRKEVDLEKSDITAMIIAALITGLPMLLLVFLIFYVFIAFFF